MVWPFTWIVAMRRFQQGATFDNSVGNKLNDNIYDILSIFASYLLLWIATRCLTPRLKSPPTECTERLGFERWSTIIKINKLTVYQTETWRQMAWSLVRRRITRCLTAVHALCKHDKSDKTVWSDSFPLHLVVILIGCSTVKNKACLQNSLI